MQRKLEPYLVLEIILLQDHIKDFAYKAVNGMKKKLDTLSLEKPTYSPNQGTVKESLVIRNVQSFLGQI